METKDRHGGLLIHEQKQVYDERDYTLSDQTRTIVMSLNSSRLNNNNNPQQLATGEQDQLANELPSRESLIELRKRQRESRQKMVYGSANLNS